MSFTAAKKNGLTDFPEKRALNDISIYYPCAKVYGISPNETQENSLSVLHFVLMWTSSNIEKHWRFLSSAGRILELTQHSYDKIIESHRNYIYQNLLKSVFCLLCNNNFRQIALKTKNIGTTVTVVTRLITDSLTILYAFYNFQISLWRKPR